MKNFEIKYKRWFSPEDVEIMLRVFASQKTGKLRSQIITAFHNVIVEGKKPSLQEFMEMIYN